MVNDPPKPEPRSFNPDVPDWVPFLLVTAILVAGLLAAYWIALP